MWCLLFNIQGMAVRGASTAYVELVIRYTQAAARCLAMTKLASTSLCRCRAQ